MTTMRPTIASGGRALPLGSVDPVASERRQQCEQHGMFKAQRLHRDIWSRCPTCMAEAEARREAELQRQRAEEERLRRAHMLDRAGLIGRFADATFASFQATTPAQRKVLQTCQHWAATATAQSGDGLMLLGSPGTGKTHLESATVRALIADRGIRARIVTARDLVRELRATWRRDAEETEDQVLERYGCGIEVLAIDDVGAGLGTDAERAQLLDVIDRRYQRRRPTLIASNLNLAGLGEAIGERSLDRLREGATVLACTWPSRRGGAA